MNPEKYQWEADALLASYEKFADFLVSVYGQQNSIVLYKTNPVTEEGFVVYSNADAYQEGSPLGEVAKKVMTGGYKGYSYLINISDETEEDACPHKFSYFLIRNSKNQIIGLLLIIFSVEYMFKAKKVLDQILGFEKINNRPREYNDLHYELEDDAFSISKYAGNIISSVIAEYQIPAECLSVDEKIEIVKKLDKMEIFNIKGSVKEAALQLMISVPTIYRHMKK